MGELETLMRKQNSSTQLTSFLFLESRWHESHDAVQCRAHGSAFEFLFEFQVVRESNRQPIDGPLYMRQCLVEDVRT